MNEHDMYCFFLQACAFGEARASCRLDGDTQCGVECPNCKHVYNDALDKCNEYGEEKG